MKSKQKHESKGLWENADSCWSGMIGSFYYSVYFIFFESFQKRKLLLGGIGVFPKIRRGIVKGSGQIALWDGVSLSWIKCNPLCYEGSLENLFKAHNPFH